MNKAAVDYGGLLTEGVSGYKERKMAPAVEAKRKKDANMYFNNMPYAEGQNPTTMNVDKIIIDAHSDEGLMNAISLYMANKS